LRYSEMEDAEAYHTIHHPLFREALRLHAIPPKVEIVSIADVPAGTGLGSSGSFLVGLLHALHAFKRQPVTADMLAMQAIDIEMDRLGEPVGKQDQYIAAYGGLLCQDFHSDGSTTMTPLRMRQSAIWELRDSLMLFFVGSTRTAAELLRDQKKQTESGNTEM